MTADDPTTTPPGKTKIELRLDAFGLNSKGTVRSPGYPDRDILLVLRQHDDHLDAMVADAVSGQPVNGTEAIAGLVERFVVDLVAELVEMTVDPTWHVHFLDADEPAPERIKPFAQPAKVVH